VCHSGRAGGRWGRCEVARNAHSTGRLVPFVRSRARPGTNGADPRGPDDCNGTSPATPAAAPEAGRSRYQLFSPSNRLGAGPASPGAPRCRSRSSTASRPKHSIASVKRPRPPRSGSAGCWCQPASRVPGRSAHKSGPGEEGAGDPLLLRWWPGPHALPGEQSAALNRLGKAAPGH